MDINEFRVQDIYSRNQQLLDLDVIAADSKWATVPDWSIDKFKNVLLTPSSLIFKNARVVTVSPNFYHSVNAIPKYKKIISYIKARFLGKIQRHHGTHMIIHDGWSTNYYHWMCEAVPRLLFIKESQNDAVVALPENFINFKFLKDTLEVLNVKYILLDLKISHHFDNLVTVGTHPVCANVVPEALFKVTEEIFKNLGIKKAAPHRKVYISRTKAPSRKIVNEAELLPHLIQSGYEVVFAEDLSFKQQVQLFAQTKSLITVHGGGLTNMVFMQPFGKILEIRAANWELNPLCYWRLANFMQLEWRYFLSKTVNRQSNFGDIEIDMTAFLNLLAEFEQEAAIANGANS